jgi:lipopolysaccharide transport system ATP-binding protein
VELGEFLHQPMKTYSLGMNARVQFAAATAITPDILIIDEVLGAGDAYFAAKSAHRMERLTSSGCTLLLISHSSTQILQFCKRVIFLHEGQVREDGAALDVVKHYEEYIAEMTQRERRQQHEVEAAAYAALLKPAVAAQHDYSTPTWQQEQMAKLLMEAPVVESNATKERVSRWAAEPGLKIKRVEVLNERGEATGTVQAGRPCAIEVEIVAEHDGDFSTRIVVLIMTLTGVGVVRHLSDEFTVSLRKNSTHVVRLEYDALQLAHGDFVFSAALFKFYDPHDSSTAVRYDLLSRSFGLKVVPVQRSEPALVNLPCSWVLQPGTT